MAGPSILVSQLISQAPTLLVYLLAAIFSLVLLRPRSAAAGWLVFAGAALSIVITLSWTFLFQGTITSSTANGRQAISLVLNLLRAICTGLIVAGAFVGRDSREQPAGFEVRPPALPPFPSPNRR